MYGCCESKVIKLFLQRMEERKKLEKKKEGMEEGKKKTKQFLDERRKERMEKGKIMKYCMHCYKELK